MSDPTIKIIPADALRLKLHAELAQLRAENKWLRNANKGLSEALDKARKLLPPEAFT